MSAAFPHVMITTQALDASDGIIVIDVSARRISRGVRSVTFGSVRTEDSKCFALTRALLTRAPRLVPREELLAIAYGSADGGPLDIYQAVNVKISDIRRRICPRLGLRLVRIGHTGVRIENDPAAQAASLERNAPRRWA